MMRLGHQIVARVLPMVPSVQDGQETFSKPLSQAAKLWKKVNAAPPAGVTGPVVLQDGTAEAGFTTAVAALYDAVVDAEQEVSLALQRRNDLQDEALRGRFSPAPRSTSASGSINLIPARISWTPISSACGGRSTTMKS